MKAIVITDTDLDYIARKIRDDFDNLDDDVLFSSRADDLIQLATRLELHELATQMYDDSKVK